VVWGWGYRVEDFKSRVCILVLKVFAGVKAFWCMVHGVWLRLKCSGLRVQGPGFRILGLRYRWCWYRIRV